MVHPLPTRDRMISCTGSDAGAGFCEGAVPFATMPDSSTVKDRLNIVLLLAKDRAASSSDVPDFRRAILTTDREPPAIGGESDRATRTFNGQLRLSRLSI